jgi:hypothetical protein
LVLDRCDLHAAAAHWQEGLRISRELEDQIGIATGMEWIAHLAAATGDGKRSARLLGAADAVRDKVGIRASPFDQAEHQRLMTALRCSLGAERAERAFSEGRALSFEDVIVEATETGHQLIGEAIWLSPMVDPSLLTDSPRP